MGGVDVSVKVMSALPAHLIDNAADGGALVGVELGHQVVCWVRHDRAEHSCNVAGREGHSQLLSLGALHLGLGHHVLVQRLNGVLKARCRAHEMCFVTGKCAQSHMHEGHMPQVAKGGALNRRSCISMVAAYGAGETHAVWASHQRISAL